MSWRSTPTPFDSGGWDSSNQLPMSGLTSALVSLLVGIQQLIDLNWLGQKDSTLISTDLSNWYRMFHWPLLGQCWSTWTQDGKLRMISGSDVGPTLVDKTLYELPICKYVVVTFNVAMLYSSTIAGLNRGNGPQMGIYNPEFKTSICKALHCVIR